MKKVHILKSMSVFSKRSVIACIIAGGILSLNSCDKDSIDNVNMSSIEPSRPPILNKVPAIVIADMNFFIGMNLNTQNRVEVYLKDMTPKKVKTINLFKDKSVFESLPQDEQIKVISEVLGFDNINEYVKYAKFMEEKRKNLVDYVKENKVSSYQLSNELIAVSKFAPIIRKSARFYDEEIPDDWVDIEAFQGRSPECQEYATCITNKMAEGVVAAAGAAIVAGAWTSWSGPGGAAVAAGTFLGGLSSAAFVTIYSATFGDCSLKRRACKHNIRSMTSGGELDPENPNNPDPNRPPFLPGNGGINPFRYPPR